MSRSAAEIAFRIRQEWANVRLWLAPPDWPSHWSFGGSLPLPPVDEVRSIVAGTAYEQELHATARRCAMRQIPAFSQWIGPAQEIEWRKDYQHGQTTPPDYFRRVPYLDFARAGDHKWIWEINRHQHLVLMAQAWALDPQASYLEEIGFQLESWLQANPPQRGINWASALEVAIRALSWIWILHLVGHALPGGLRVRLLASLRAHARHLAANLSVYFSPNTHLLGEALALDALGRFLEAAPESATWRQLGSYWLDTCLARQVTDDGSYFEQSSFYHIYALDMFLLAAIWRRESQRNDSLDRMAIFAQSMLGADGRLPLLGDDDGGRLFHPFGPRPEFGRGTMAVYAALGGTIHGDAAWLDREAACPLAAWWLGARAARCWETPRHPAIGSRLFESSGLVSLSGQGVEALVDAGPFGPGSAGHSHADTLSLTIRRHGREVLIDPGTFTYLADPAWREHFRQNTAHNTLVVAGLPQAATNGPFRWRSTPRVHLVSWRTSAEEDHLEAICEYGPIRHRRRVRFDKIAVRLEVTDRIESETTPGPIALHWHLPEDPVRCGPHSFLVANARITLDKTGETSIEQGWRSLVFGTRQPAPVLLVRWPQPECGVDYVTVFDWDLDSVSPPTDSTRKATTQE